MPERGTTRSACALGVDALQRELHAEGPDPDRHVRGVEPLPTHGTENAGGVLTVAGFGYGVFAVRG